MRNLRVCRVVFFLAVVGQYWTSAHGRGPVPEPGEKYALLVGVRTYDPNELRSLPYSESDVEELAKVLRAQGYRSENLVLMTQAAGARNPRFAPIEANIRKELALLLEDRTTADSVIVALAGHGVQFPNDQASYFCGSDARLSNKSTLISLDEIYQQLDRCGAGLKLLLVDACRNDPQSDNSRARDGKARKCHQTPERTAWRGRGAVQLLEGGKSIRARQPATRGLLLLSDRGVARPGRL
jgi:hypothetical protein